MRTLVTGATGFIGRELCRQLVARGDDLVATSQNGGVLPGGHYASPLDLQGSVPEAAALQGVDVVYHLAGVAHQYAEAVRYDAVNYHATMAMARAAHQAGVGYFVYLSSVKAMGLQADGKPRAEGDTVEPGDAYGASKWRAECDLRAEFSGGAMTVIILRPAVVYGAALKGNLKLLLQAARLGLPAPPAGGARSMVGVTDLAALLCTLPSGGFSGLHTWIVTDGQAYSTREMYAILRMALQRPVRNWQAPLWLWRTFAALLDRWQRQPSGTSFGKLFDTEVYSNSALLAATNWRPRQSLATMASELVSGERLDR
ncbi:NAD-dependent epimerase/dehydratase family protein [Kineobactrum sediminis]|uniref:NAD-dependent epimerase/dehydratase family protein n=1 Tax=Kineobactrum sediminis TaxID=1905677 RepID=UPI0013901996|nr:NAD-dependent epimerase/dehydratase family protein [Kineobactrum sediminis]